MKPAILVTLSMGLFAAGCRQSTPASPPSVAVVAEESQAHGTQIVSESDLGLPFYPGSEPKGSSSKVMETPKDRTVYCDRVTKDSMQKVADFYKSKLIGGHGGSTSPSTMLFEGRLKAGATVSILIARASQTETEFSVTVHTLKEGGGSSDQSS